MCSILWTEFFDMHTIHRYYPRDEKPVPAITTCQNEKGLCPGAKSGKGKPRRPLIGISLILMILVPVFIPALSAGQDFEEWLRQEQQQFEDFRAKQNREFAEMLQQQWEAMYSNEPESLLEENKPVSIPVADTLPEAPVKPTAEPDSDPQPQPRPDPEPEPEPEPEPPAQKPPPPPLPEPPAQKPPPDPLPEPPAQEPSSHPEPEPEEDLFTPPAPGPGLSAISIDFFGHNLDVPFDPALNQITLGNPFNAEAIASVWEQFSDTEIDASVGYYQHMQERMRLNDWGLAQLIFSSGLAVFSDNRDLARLYTWFMLIQSGQKARIGFNDNGVILMLATQTHVFGTPFFRFNGQPFFMAHFDKLPPEPQRVYTYGSDFPGDLAPLSLGMPATPVFRSSYTERNLHFTFRGEEIRVAVPVNRNLISFYEFYPQTELEVYFNAPVTETTANGLLDSLERYIDGKSEKETIHLLLRFAQTAFGYKIDPDNFGREKPLFPEETLYYDYSDCEDRAILFSFLVRNLTGLDVVGLRYPGHIATAIRFNEPVSGDTVDIDGMTYHICDPTYINAAPGMAMEQFKNVIPEIITLGSF